MVLAPLLFSRLESGLRLFLAAALAMAWVSASAQNNQRMPREHIIDVPAVGEGLCLHNLFQSNMVLQRDKPIAIWGWAAPGERIVVSFAGQSAEAVAEDNRSWKIMLDSLPADSRPQSLTATGKEKELVLENILVGDVWVLGGQSNMEFPLSNVENGELEIVSANYPGIRILTVPAQDGPDPKTGFPRLHEWSDWHSRHFRKGDWDVCSPDIARELSAIGFVFARRIHMAAQVPIGVIDASRGGTTVETWTPIEVLKKTDTKEVKTLLSDWEQKIAEWDPHADLEKRIRNHENYVEKMKKEGKQIPKNRTTPTDLRPGPAMDQNRPGNCYASMIVPLEGLSVKGAIFHQGFNNALGGGTEGATMYYQVFGKMITAWRKAFNDPEMPFGIISLCTAGDPQTLDDYLEKMLNDGIYIREVQYKTFLDFLQAGDRNIGFASSFDQRRSWYHPRLKIPVGERISRWALATQYGFEKEIKWMPPIIEEMKVEDGKISLRMDTNVVPLDDGPILGFAIAGEDRRFQPADAAYLVTGRDERNQPQLDRRTIVLSSPHVPDPIHFRYAWGRNPMGNLYSADRNDLPLATQRSDDWEMEKVPVDVIGIGLASETNDQRKIKSLIQKELRLDDLERRLKEAKTFVEENQERYEKKRTATEEAKEKARKQPIRPTN